MIDLQRLRDYFDIEQYIKPRIKSDILQGVKAEACIDTITQLKIMASTELAVKNDRDAQVIHDWIEDKGNEVINAIRKKDES